MDKQQLDGETSHLGHRERLRERFINAGLSGFAPHEALELLLTYAIPRQDVKPLANRLIRHFGSLNGVLEASSKDLQAVPGIGKSASVLLSLLLPLFRLYHQNGQAQKGASMGAAQLKAHCLSLFLGERVEHFQVLSLDAKGRLLDSSRISSGDEGETAVYPRLIIRELLRTGAAACVLAHNHPTGVAAPSKADIALTRSLRDLLLPLSITLTDHIITAGTEAYSFRDHGLLSVTGGQDV